MGTTDYRKIARLDACALVELAYKFNFDFLGAAALSISDNSEALVCFDNSNHKYCDLFTGTNIVSTHSTTYSHRFGHLGSYNGQPTTVGSYNSDGYRKTETLTSTGWQSLADHPRNSYAHQLVGLQNGDLLMFAGTDRDDNHAYVTSIWRLSNNLWTEEGNLQQVSCRKFLNSVFSSYTLQLIEESLRRITDLTWRKYLRLSWIR